MIRRLNLILGDQLNRDSLLWQDIDAEQDEFWMAEVIAESNRPASNKQRSILFLSAMRHFTEAIKAEGFFLHYFSIDAQRESLSSALSPLLAQSAFTHIRCVLPGDVSIMKQLERCCDEHQLKIEWLADNHFITRRGEFHQWMKERIQPRMENWYRYLRQDRQILMDDNNKPTGGRWNFDKDNRKSFNKSGPPDTEQTGFFEPDAITLSVINDIEKYLPNLPGQAMPFHWPVTREQALALLDDFIQQRLPQFGDYQDAMWQDAPFLFHARLSSSLNLKLLHPQEVIDAAERAYHQGKAPINAVEGFIRQILGWREYVRGLYWYYREYWLDYNALDAQNDLPAFYWDADTEMVCLHQAIAQVLTHGYGHHIQRLMVTGLFSLLWGVKPQQIHDWYLGMYVDAVAWVEIPNTLGMSQYADGGIVGSKPYIASGAYINRMSNYCDSCPYDPKQAAGEQACPFTTLYWSFIDQHQEWLATNPRLGMQVRNWQNKGNDEQTEIRERAAWLYAHMGQRKNKETQ